MLPFCVAFQRNGGYLLRQNTGLPKVVCVTCESRAHIVNQDTWSLLEEIGSDVPGYKNISDPFK